MNSFILPTLAFGAGVILVGLWGGFEAAVIATLLVVMEISLSFDNAVVNAAVLRRMSPRWQRVFLTWGILIAVFGMRLVFPVLIVALATGLGMFDVAVMAVKAPDEYSHHLESAHTVISMFGGMFLLMVFLQFVCDQAKDTHWIGPIERKLIVLGRLEAVEVALALSLLLVLNILLPDADKLPALVSGVLGVVTFLVAKGFAGLSGEGDAAAVGVAGRAGFSAFIYLEILDASFSLDGVIGAFAMSRDVVTIAVGLGVGALYVRTLTVFLVRKGSLEEFAFLEHGAHWGIGALAMIMLASNWVEVPEVVTGLIGVSVIGLAVLSSVRKNRGLRE